jgi:prolipoprotein diacylglyceryl transferase
MFVNNINPILFDSEFISIRWYGLFLGLGVGFGLYTLIKLAKRGGFDPDQILLIALWLIIGGLVGARLGHIIFYNFEYFASQPSEILMINHGGLSSHGMAIGLIVTFYLIVHFKKLAWRKLIDLFVLPIPLIASFIRIGNFFNSEIVGKETNLPWAVQFSIYESNPVSRHPSQLYEAIIALVIFATLMLVHDKLRNAQLAWLFIFLYFSSRFLIEFVKEYPTFVGLSMGQWLSIPFILISIFLLIRKSNIQV